MAVWTGMNGVISHKHRANHVILEMAKIMIAETFTYYNNSNFTYLDDSAGSNKMQVKFIRLRSRNPIDWIK